MIRAGKKAVIPAILILIVAVPVGYRYRGYVRMKMLQFLHSFDDVPEVQEETKMPPGAWWEARETTLEEDGLTDIEREQMELLRSIGYLPGYEEAPVEMGVTVHDTSRAFQGYNILISGHGPGVTMTDMNGEVVHDWFNNRVSIYGLWPETQAEGMPFEYWRRTHLDENGDLTVMIEAGGVVKVDRDSNLLWYSDWNGAHHDISVDSEGNVYAIGRTIHENPSYFPEKTIAEDFIVILDSLGNEIRRISTLDVIRDSRYAPVLRRMPDGGDVLHANTIEYIEPDALPEGYEGPLRPNTVLLSHRAIDLVCAVDLEEETVYWAESDLWHMQHQPTVLEDGTMLVYDNQGLGEISTVLQFDPATSEVLWLYRGDSDNPFYSVGSGSCQRLPNGNTLITESMMGRAFEVTPQGEIVWEFYNPQRAGENQELIATLFEVVRVPPEMVEGWLLE